MEKILNFIKREPLATIGVLLIAFMLVMVIFFSPNQAELDEILAFQNRSENVSISSTTTMTLDIANRDSRIMIQGPATLRSIGLGINGGQIALFDSLTIADATSIIFTVTGSLARVWDDLDIDVSTGILMNTTDQNNVMFFYTPK